MIENVISPHAVCIEAIQEAEARRRCNADRMIEIAITRQCPLDARRPTLTGGDLHLAASGEKDVP